MEDFSSWWSRMSRARWCSLCYGYDYGDDLPALHWKPAERRSKARVGVTINHRQPRSKARAKMAQASRRINRA